MRFRVGDVVVLKALRPQGAGRGHVGMEGTVAAVGPFGDERVFGFVWPGQEYIVAWHDYSGACGDKAAVMDWQLAPKRPPAFERGSWDEIERVTGWSPKVVA